MRLFELDGKLFNPDEISAAIPEKRGLKIILKSGQVLDFDWCEDTRALHEYLREQVHNDFADDFPKAFYDAGNGDAADRIQQILDELFPGCSVHWQISSSREVYEITHPDSIDEDNILKMLPYRGQSRIRFIQK